MSYSRTERYQHWCAGCSDLEAECQKLRLQRDWACRELDARRAELEYQGEFVIRRMRHELAQKDNRIANLECELRQTRRAPIKIEDQEEEQQVPTSRPLSCPQGPRFDDPAEGYRLSNKLAYLIRVGALPSGATLADVRTWEAEEPAPRQWMR